LLANKFDDRCDSQDRNIDKPEQRAVDEADWQSEPGSAFDDREPDSDKAAQENETAHNLVPLFW
jgi:hypothetical protein